MLDAFGILIDKFIKPPLLFAGNVLLYSSIVFLAFLVYCLIKYEIPLTLKGRTKARTLGNLKRFQQKKIKMKIFDFLRWLIVDSAYKRRNVGKFKEHGFTIYCGRQGRGKTISMIFYANMIHFLYPECIIVANFKYKYADLTMQSWRDLMTIRNGERGVLFLIDEIHSEYSSDKYKDFPEEILSEVSQQRKQRVKICATSQVYKRVVKQLREQAMTVVQCSTLFGRWTFNKEYDAKDYEIACETSQIKKLKPVTRRSFVQSNALRKCYDTYEKIERLSKEGFINRKDRGSAAS